MTANLIFPTGTSDNGGDMLLEVHLAGSLCFCYAHQPDIFLLKMYVCYVVMKVIWNSVHSLHLDMNEYWLMRAFLLFILFKYHEPR